MKLSAFALLLMAGFLISGCASHKQKASKPTPAIPSVIITPDASLTGKVILYKDEGRYAVLSFPVGQMPKADQVLFVYRSGLKAGELRVNSLQRDNFIVADLVAGDVQAGDDVRDR